MQIQVAIDAPELDCKSAVLFVPSHLNANQFGCKQFKSRKTDTIWLAYANPLHWLMDKVHSLTSLWKNCKLSWSKLWLHLWWQTALNDISCLIHHLVSSLWLNHRMNDYFDIARKHSGLLFVGHESPSADQSDGNYWHLCLSCYRESTLHQIQIIKQIPESIHIRARIRMRISCSWITIEATFVSFYINLCISCLWQLKANMTPKLSSSSLLFCFFHQCLLHLMGCRANKNFSCIVCLL